MQWRTDLNHVLIHRLQGGRATNLDIQRALRITLRYTDSLNERADIQYALAEVAIDRSASRRAQILLANMLGKTSRVAVSRASKPGVGGVR